MLYSSSQDGTIGIIRTRDWELVKLLDGHKHSVHSIHVHPTGKVMLSVGRDGTLKCWNLQKGNCGIKGDIDFILI